MGQFKFLDNDSSEEIPIEEIPQDLELNVTSERDVENNAIITRITIDREITPRSLEVIKIAARRQLLNLLWDNGQILHETISEDENGLTMRTELIFR